MKGFRNRIILLFLIFSLACPIPLFAQEKNDKYIKILQGFELDDFGILALYATQGKLTSKTLQKPQGPPLTDYESYILGAIPLGRNIKTEVDLIKKSQLKSGKFADFSDRTGEDLVNSHIWAIISLYCANEDGYNKKEALNWLLRNQNIDGGFPIYTNSSSDLDMTYMAIISLKMLGEDLNSPYIKAGFEYANKVKSKYQTSESKSWEIIAKDFVGIKVPLSDIKELLSYRLANGSFEHTKGSGSTYMSTWHGILAHQEWKDTNSNIFDRLRKISKK